MSNQVRHELNLLDRHLNQKILPSEGDMAYVLSAFIRVSIPSLA